MKTMTQQQVTALRDSPAHAPGTFRPHAILTNSIVSAFIALTEWQHRASERRHLRDLEARFLEDVGMSLEDRDREVRKPFWQR